jgi:hypothetical protein
MHFLPMECPFPLRPNFTAQLVLPRDLTKEEVERLYKYMLALVAESSED